MKKNFYSSETMLLHTCKGYTKLFENKWFMALLVQLEKNKAIANARR